jgi:hypothetical protein
MGSAVAMISGITPLRSTGKGLMLRTNAKLFPRSARDWISALPRSNSPSGTSFLIHFLSKAWVYSLARDPSNSSLDSPLMSVYILTT